MQNKQEIACIIGATASGKTAVGIELAKLFNSEVISCDSIQVYKGLDIGSAKPTPAEMQGIPHHLIDCVDITDREFSASCYKTMATKVINTLCEKNMLPIIVGGTGLYLNALTTNLNFAEVKADLALREKLKQMELNEKGYLHSYLETIDMQSAERLHENDIKRLVRAIEVYTLTGKPLSQHGSGFWTATTKENMPYEAYIYEIILERQELYRRIESRVDKMLYNGLEKEVEGLIKSGYDTTLPALQGLGYKQLIAYKNGLYDSILSTTKAIKQETRRFAKRQLTWFRRDKRIIEIQVDGKTSKEIADFIFNDIKERQAIK